MTFFNNPATDTITPPAYSEITDSKFHLELAVNDAGRLIVFHSRPFTKRLSWLEFDMTNSKLDFIMNDGDVRQFGVPVHGDLAKLMQNTYQIMVVQVDEDTMEPEEAVWMPLILHSH